MTIKPINYNLTFEPDLKKFTFTGKEILTFKVTVPTKRIELDTVELKIANVILASDEGARPESEQRFWSRRFAPPQNDDKPSFKMDEKNEKLIINFSQELKPSSEYKLFIEFQGVLNDKLAGFYRSKYTSEVSSNSSFTSEVKKKPNEKYLATTQFEAADARRAFPCIDNPSFKATFDVSFIIDKNLTAISNTLPIGTVTKPFPTPGVGNVDGIGQNKKIVKFARTPLMSTYLLYFGVGEFEFLQDKYTSEVSLNSTFTSEVKKRNVLLRVVTRPGKSKFGKFALGCAQKFLKFYEEYFDHPYPLKKLDLIAIPDFASGAMENWGAITFRENALLFYPGKSSKATMQRISEVIAHELVHQWFGNLVTMKWWDDIWLNESFATYMAYKALDHFWPEWKVWDQYVIDTVFEGMALDSLKSSHPIKVDVKGTSGVEELFDEISYDKGGSILRMLDLYLGERVFRDGLRNYLRTYKYKNAEAKDLWNSLESCSNKPVLGLMQKYITQIGFPQITIAKSKDHLELAQKRFLLLDGIKDQTIWNIPLVIQYGDNKVFSVILNEAKRSEESLNLFENLASARDSSRTFRMTRVKKIKFININSNYSSFFISNYSNDLLNMFGKNISLAKHSDKLGLVHDLFSLILAEKKNLNELYRCIDTFYSRERSSIVLHYIISKLTRIYLLIRDHTSKSLAIGFSQKALGKIVGYGPKKDENILDTYLRSAALSSLTFFDDKTTAQFIKNQFGKYLKNEKLLHPDLRSVVYSSSVWFEEANYPIIKNLYRISPVQEEKAKLLMALGNTKSKKLITGTLEYSLDKDVPFAFLPYAISSIARNPFAKDITLDWLITSWPELVKRSGGLTNILVRRILQSIVPICGIGREKEVIDFFEKNKVEGLKRTVDQVMEELRINSRFVFRYRHKSVV